MTDKSEWVEGEFVLLLSRPDLADDGFADIIPDRDKEDIGGVRAAVHGFHAGGDTSMLSEMMLSLLGSKDTLVTCPICKVSF